MKKIISIFAVLIVSLTAFCLPAFALEPTEATFDTFTLNGKGLFNYASPVFYGVTVDYQRDPLSQYPWIFQYETINGGAKFKTVEFRFYTDDDVVKTDYGDIFQFTMKDITTFDLYDMSKDSYVKINYRVKRKSGWEKWQSWKDFKWSRDSDGEFHIDFDFYYKNDGAKLTDMEFEIGFYSYTDIEFRYPLFEFPQYAINVYNGPSSDPSAPQYAPHNNTINKTDNLKEQEDKLMEDTEEGKEETLSLFQNFGKYLDEFAVPLLAIKGLFDYLVGGTLFEGILLISLTLGLLSFVFNIFPSIQARQNRERQAEAQRTKNAQYNAMMNKLNNQNKGGG